MPSAPLQQVRRAAEHAPTCKVEAEMKASDLNIFAFGYSLNFASFSERLKVIEAVIERSISGIRRSTTRAYCAIKIHRYILVNAQSFIRLKFNPQRKVWLTAWLAHRESIGVLN